MTLIIIIIIILLKQGYKIQDAIGKIIKYRWLVNKLASSWVIFESSPWGSIANRAGKNSKISKTRKETYIQL